MKSNFVFPVVVVASAFLLGCSRQSEELAALETVVVGPEYSASKGIHVPEETRRSLGLKVVDVGEAPVVGHLTIPLRVYAAAGELARASGTVPLSRAEAVQVGQPVEVTSPENGSVTGRVMAVRREMEKVTGAVEVLVEFPGAFGSAPAGFATGRIVLGGGAAVATVPRSALVESVEGPFVYTESGSHFVRTAVKLGAIDNQTAEVTEGLYVGDRVVSEPAMSLWLTELAAIKGGHACCAVPAKGR